MTWQKQRDELGFVHYLPLGVGNYSMKVEKSTGGDYFLTVYLEGDVVGGDVEYCDTLPKAKKRAEELINNGEWVYLALDPDEAIVARDSAK